MFAAYQSNEPKKKNDWSDGYQADNEDNLLNSNIPQTHEKGKVLIK